MTTYSTAVCLFLVILQVSESLAIKHPQEKNIKRLRRGKKSGDKDHSGDENDIIEVIFEYTGCINDKSIPDTERHIKNGTEGSLSQCYSDCNYSENIGLTKEKCYCFASSPNDWSKNLLCHDCNDACGGQDSVACGGRKGNESYVSLYKKIKVKTDEGPSASKDTKDAAKCLKIKPLHSDRWKWVKCDENNHVMCTDSGRLTPKGNWLSAAKRCFKENKFLIPYSMQGINTDEQEFVWTGVFKLNIKHNFASDTTSTSDTTTTSETQHTQTTLSQPRTDATDTAKITTTTTTTTTTIDNRLIQTTMSPPSINTGTAAIVSVTILLVVTVVAVTCVLIYRYKFYSQRFKRMPETNETVDGSENNYPEFTNNSADVDAHFPRAVEYNYPDFSISETMNTEGINTDLDTYESSYSVAKEVNIPDGTYNYAKTNENSTGELSDNVYNILEHGSAYNVLGTKQTLVSGKSYDNVALVQRSGASAADDTTYDLSMSAGIKLKIGQEEFTDNVYNTIN